MMLEQHPSRRNGSHNGGTNGLPTNGHHQNGKAKAPEPPERTYDIAVLGLSISSSWGNGHATTYRSLLRAMSSRGHEITFYERDVPWYKTHRDLSDPSFCRLELYESLAELRKTHASAIRGADVVIVGSFVPDGVDVLRWVLDTAEGWVAFYDIDTPVTLSKISKRDYEYIHPDLMPAIELYLSFTGGKTLDRLEEDFGVQSARPLFCSVDPDEYYPDGGEISYDLGYMGTYSDDRQPRLEKCLVDAARKWPEGRFIVAGPGYPDDLGWPANISRVHHLAPADHRRFYNSQRFTLNITREEMVRVGYAPSVRLFEAAACGTPIVSDYWEGLETLFEPGSEVLLSSGGDDTLRHLREISEEDRREIGSRARHRVLSAHTAAHRARELESYLDDIRATKKDYIAE